jgi:hypothetical protein
MPIEYKRSPGMEYLNGRELRPDVTRQHKYEPKVVSATKRNRKL